MGLKILGGSEFETFPFKGEDLVGSSHFEKREEAVRYYNAGRELVEQKSGPTRIAAGNLWRGRG
jgi:hypothetical protein